jgi:hypothetical protein
MSSPPITREPHHGDSMKRFALIILLVAGNVQWVAAADLPLVFKQEDTGASRIRPPLPAVSDLPSIAYLPDPFLMANGKHVTTRDNWEQRRAEIRAMLEHYDVGAKPGKPSTFRATLEGNTIHMMVGEGVNTFEMTATVNRPADAPDTPIPVLIGINSPSGSLPSNLIASRGIATITFKTNEVAYSGFSGVNYEAGNFAKVYPDSTAGYLIRWAWGVSRIIDALEALPQAKLDLSHIAVTGCSYAGKAALYAGAWDGRIALTIPQESGGGGTISWRYSDMLEKRDGVEVENLIQAQGGSVDFPWYARALRQFTNAPEKLPVDHHELIALIAPRAVLMIESTRVPRMGAEAARVDALAAREVWKALGVADRMGVTEEDTPHCQWHSGFTPDLEAYLDRFMLDKTSGRSTDILRSRFAGVDRATWIPWQTPALKR